MLTKNEIVAAINLAYDATCDSRVGSPIVQNELGEEQIRNLAFNTFLAVLAKSLPITMEGQIEATETTNE